MYRPGDRGRGRARVPEPSSPRRVRRLGVRLRMERVKSLGVGKEAAGMARRPPAGGASGETGADGDVVLGRSSGRWIPAESGMFAGKLRQTVRPARESTARCRDLA
jgi:hypothetical protein